MEQLALQNFLKTCPPLDRLDEDALSKWVEQCTITYWRAGETILEIGGTNHLVSLVRSGAVAAHDEAGRLVNLIGERDWFGYRSVLNGGRVSLKLVAREDTLACQFPAELFLDAYHSLPAFPAFFARHKPARVKNALQRLDLNQINLCEPVGRHARPLARLHLTDSTREAARALGGCTHRVLIQAENSTPHALVGDEDIRMAVARDILPETRLEAWLEKHPPLQLPADYPLGKALVRMLEKGQTHALVRDGEQWRLFALSQLRQQADHYDTLAARINQADDIDALKPVAEQIQRLFVTLVDQRMDPLQVEAIISALNQALTARAVHLCERSLGDAPVPYAFAVAGSLARKEQTIKTDQDNAMVLHDDYQPERHGDYFENLAHQINDALAQLGFDYCPGEVMARNPRWRMRVSDWRRTFSRWMAEPDAEALLEASIFFDMIAVVDDAGLMPQLTEPVLTKAADSGLFLRHLADNALRFRPPLGFFRHLILERDGERGDVLNIKKRGIAPVVELARVHALSGGIRRLNTASRLRACAQAGIISQDGYEDLRDAWVLISHIRQQHQARCLEQGQPADNLINPEELSHLERRHLKDAFTVIRDMQEALALRYQLR